MKVMTPWQIDKKRNDYPPPYLYWYRAYHRWPSFLKPICQLMLRIFNFSYKVDFPYKAKIGPGLSIIHPYGIVINPQSVIGSNCNIHKGVTIGQENRGKRKGVPTIGNNVWIGINATVVGNIKIGDDVLIAAGAFVNVDVPSHSVVYGNPCIIKHRENATYGYISSLTE